MSWHLLSKVVKSNCIFANMAKSIYPRGIRNNNPCNIRTTTPAFIGSLRNDGGFIVFTDIAFGFRAFFKLLVTYRQKYNVVKLYDIVCRYAPDFENKTDSYVKFVSRKLDIAPTDEVTTDRYMELALCIALYENGYEYKTYFNERLGALYLAYCMSFGDVPTPVTYDTVLSKLTRILK